MLSVTGISFIFKITCCKIKVWGVLWMLTHSLGDRCPGPTHQQSPLWSQPPLPQAPASRDLFSVWCRCLSHVPYDNQVKPCIVYFLRLASFSGRAAAWDCQSRHCLDPWSFLSSLQHSLLISSSPAKRHLGCFQSGAFISKAFIHMCMQLRCFLLLKMSSFL